MTTTQASAQIRAIVPTLTVDDLQKSIAFYEALGFRVGDKWEHQGTLLGVMMTAGSAEIGLNQDDWKKGRDRKKGLGVRISFSALPERIDEIANRLRAAGVPLTSEPHDTEYIGRAFEVTDPSGYLLTVFSES